MRTVVIGGGIIGLASAYYLSERGVDTTVLERSSVGSGNTSRANGGIRAQFSSQVSVELSRRSIDVWESFEEEFGTNIQYRRPGYLFLARTDSTADRFRENVRIQNDLGVDSEFLSPAEAAELCPELNTELYRGAAYSADDGFADPNLGLQGFSTAASEAGVEIRTGVAVTDVLQEAPDGTVTGVRIAGGETIAADYAVNASGAWAAEIGELAGLDLPVSPRRRQLMIVEPETPVDSSVPFTIDLDESVHFRPERNGSAVVGGDFSETDPEKDPDGFKEKMDLDWAMTTVEAASTVADYFGPESRVKRGWAGLYAVTPDHHPIIEETVPGFVNVVGFSGHGFMQSPAAGQLVAEIVADGHASLIDITDLSADRFERCEGLEEGTVIN